VIVQDIGTIISLFRMPAFIVTLASMIGVRCLARWITNNENIDVGFGADAAARFAELLSRKTIVVGTFAISAAVFWLILERTVFGRYIRAVGDNEKAAHYTGLPIRRVRIWVYGLSGLMTGIAGLIYAAENHQGNPNAGIGLRIGRDCRRCHRRNGDRGIHSRKTQLANCRPE
jgi:ribose/xylose/arabinose/galactoside ABC-type transport system permease subunit